MASAHGVNVTSPSHVMTEGRRGSKVASEVLTSRTDRPAPCADTPGGGPLRPTRTSTAGEGSALSVRFKGVACPLLVREVDGPGELCDRSRQVLDGLRNLALRWAARRWWSWVGSLLVVGCPQADA